jgi:hypothetical protein
VVAIGSIIGNAEIQAAWPDWNTTDTATMWTCWIVTQKALGYVRVEYDRAHYDEYQDRQNPLTPSNQSAWVRPLASVVELRWGAVYEAQAYHDTYHLAEPIMVTFTDRETTIPEEAHFPVEHRPTADLFLTALLKGVNI